MNSLHQIELLETDENGYFDIRVDGYVHKRHRHLPEDAAEKCASSLRTYYNNIGERCRIVRPACVT